MQADHKVDKQYHLQESPDFFHCFLPSFMVDLSAEGALFLPRSTDKEPLATVVQTGRNAVKVDFLGEKFWIEKDLLEVPGFGDDE